MSETESKQVIQIPAEKLIDALLHARQFEQHYATQESVNHLNEQMNTRFAQVNDRLETIEQHFSQVNKRFDEIKADNRYLNNKLYHLQWFIVAAALALILKDYVFRSIAGI